MESATPQHLFNMKRAGHVLFTLLTCLATLSAQETPILETLLEDVDPDNIRSSSLIETLQNLQDRPIYFRTATLEDLLQIPFLDHASAREILRYRRMAGNVHSFADIARNTDLSAELLAAIRPFISLESRQPGTAFQYQMQLRQAFPASKAFIQGTYSHPLNIFQKVFWQPRKDLKMGLLWQKDAGEGRIFDFGSIYFTWQKASWHLHVGDYVVRSGQQLLFSAAYGAPFSLESGSLFGKSSLRWHPKRSGDENAFLRGLHFGWQNQVFAGALFLSSQRIDAVLNEDSLTVRSLYSSGYHRTAREENNRDRLAENIIGIASAYHSGYWSAGFAGALTQYDLPLLTNDFIDSLKSSFNGSLYHSLTHNALAWQGEFAMDQRQNMVLQQTIRLKPKNKRWQYRIVYYRYSPAYFARLGRAVGQTSQSPSNNTGIYLNGQISIEKLGKLSTYFQTDRPLIDQARFIYRRQSWQIQWSQKLNGNEMRLRYSMRRRRNRQPAIDPDLFYHALRFELKSKIAKTLQLTSRAEFSSNESWQKTMSNHGTSLFLDLRWQLHSSLRLQARWTQFAVNSFDERIYEFENGIPGSFDNVLLDGRGYKWFLKLDWKPAKNWQLAVRYRRLFYPDQTTIGSGLSQIIGNYKEEVAVHIRFKDK